MKPAPRIGLIAAVIGCVALGLVGPVPVGAVQNSEEMEEMSYDPKPISVDFAGGPASGYVEMLAKVSQRNIVVLSDLAKINLPPVRLTNVDIESALSVLNHLPREQGDYYVRVSISEERGNSDMAPVFAIAAEIEPRQDFEALQTVVLEFDDLIRETVTAEGVLTAIEAAQTLLKDKGSPPEMKYHEDTRLLIARGRGEQIALMEQVIEQLRERAHRVEATRESQRLQESQAQHADQLAAKLHTATAEAEESRRQAAEWRIRCEMMEQQMRALQEEAAKAREAATALRLELDRVMNNAGAARP